MINLEKRDGVARIGKLEINGRMFEVPLMIDFLERYEFEDLISRIDFGIAPYVLKDIDSKRFEVLRSRNENLIVATGLSVLSPRKLVETLIELRDGSFKPLYTPALATPKNLPLLVYFGVDIVDNILPIVKAYEGIYMLENCEFELKSLKSLPCNCEICRNHSVKDMDEELIAKHNTAVLRRQIDLIKEQIRSENLRNFVEAHAKFDPELTAMLRIGDENSEFFKRYCAIFKKSKLTPTSEDSFSRYEVSTFFERAIDAYKPKSEVLLILPCSARKPYMLSRSHSKIRSHLGDLLKGVEEIIVSSPLVVPRVFELTYPAINYDVPVTGYWSGDEIRFVAERLAGFIGKGEFEVIIAHVEGGYRKVVESLGIDVIFTAEGEVTSQKSLKNLRRALEGVAKRDFDLYLSIFEHMLRYQFGIELSELGDNLKVRGRYPNLELFKGKNRIARIDVNYGMLDVYMPLAKLMLEKNAYTVRIDNFEPKGTIFAVGVKNADERIRPNDIVVFHNDELIGVGRAIMTGIEMVEVDRGYAIEVKRYEKL